MALMTLATLAALPLLTDPLATMAMHAEDGQVWAGHQVTRGRRDIPFKGKVTTRTDTWLLARVHRDGDAITLTQEACAVAFKPVGGVKVRMDARSLPANEVEFTPNGVDLKGSSLVSWKREDVDGDGHPGMTVHVDSSVCSGELYVSNRSRTRARAIADGGALRGKALVTVDQEVLGAKGACLSMVASDTHELVSGPFAYTPVDRGATCSALLEGGWPIDATD